MFYKWFLPGMPAWLLMSAALALFPSWILAGPGAHGPNGEHLDAPAQVAPASAIPRLESSTETFELVARLQDGALSLLIDRFASNAPVLNATVEVELAGIKAPAKFQPDHGDYAVTEPQILAILNKPGSHALVINVLAGEDNDLLEGVLVHADTVRATPHSHWQEVLALTIAGGALALLLLVLWKAGRFTRNTGATP